MITTRMTTHPLANTLDRIGTLNRVLNQVLPESLGSAAPLWVSPLAVAERADAYLIAVDLPGVREEELELGFESNVSHAARQQAAQLLGGQRRRADPRPRRRAPDRHVRALRAPP